VTLVIGVIENPRSALEQSHTITRTHWGVLAFRSCVRIFSGLTAL
jgi:hypothetical protein